MAALWSSIVLREQKHQMHPLNIVPRFFFLMSNYTNPLQNPDYWTHFFFLCVNKRNKRQHRKNSTQPQRREASPARLRDLAAKQRDALWSSIMHTGKNKQTNAHMKYSPSRFWQMKSFAILVHSPVSTVTNSPEIWMQITYLKGPNSHFQYNASFWSIVRSRVYTPPLPFASDCIFQMPRADESPPRTHKSFSDNEAKC